MAVHWGGYPWIDVLDIGQEVRRESLKTPRMHLALPTRVAGWQSFRLCVLFVPGD